MLAEVVFLLAIASSPALESTWPPAQRVPTISLGIKRSECEDDFSSSCTANYSPNQRSCCRTRRFNIPNISAEFHPHSVSLGPFFTLSCHFCFPSENFPAGFLYKILTAFCLLHISDTRSLSYHIILDFSGLC